MPNGAPDGAPLAIEEERIPGKVSAAWELELIIAGAVTFALLQLPGSLDTIRDRMLGRADGGAVAVITIGHLYARIVVYVLIGSFLLNLVARAYWVGLVGLQSVFPRGVQWDQIGSGPVFTDVYRQRIPSLDRVIERVDNFASVIFSFAFVLVLAFLFSLTVMGTLGGIAYAIGWAVLGSARFETITLGVAAVYVLPNLVFGLIDKKIGPRLAPDGAGYRRLRAVARWVTRVNGSALIGAIMFTLFSNIGRKRMALLSQAVLLSACALAIVGVFNDLDAFRSGTPAYVPDDKRVDGVSTENYESLRAPGASVLAPTIQSDVVDGPYVRLFVPYDAERMDPAIARTCPGIAPLRAGRFHLLQRPANMDSARQSASRVLDCIGRVYALALDGAPARDAALHYYVHPSTNRYGVLAYLPTASLRSGMHTLTIQRPALPDATKPPLPVEIPFWK